MFKNMVKMITTVMLVLVIVKMVMLILAMLIITVHLAISLVVGVEAGDVGVKAAQTFEDTGTLGTGRGVNEETRWGWKPEVELSGSRKLQFMYSALGQS